MNKVCEHEWVKETSTVCRKCGESWPHIEIGKQGWEDIEKEFDKSAEHSYYSLRDVVFDWLKENYLAPEKKNS